MSEKPRPYDDAIVEILHEDPTFADEYLAEPEAAAFER